MQEQSTTTTTTETRAFQAETAKILDLMIHSVYSNREVFLRELISNASDAIDKVRFQALTDAALRDAGDHDYSIVLQPDADAGTLTIRDNGIGMTYDEVIENIGTIARSGTAEFVRRLEEAQKSGDMALIGRFGIGFYSAFIVADRVELRTTRHDADHGVRWTSAGDGSYEIERTAAGPRGTTITLWLKKSGESDEEYKDFSQAWVLRDVVRRHSDYVTFPIVLETRKEPEADAEQGGDEVVSADPVVERETLNRQKPLWARDPKEITTDEHAEFYRHLTHDWNKPVDQLHFSVEGMHSFTALLYLAERAPADLYAREGRRGLSLYVRNVFVMDQCRELLPEYLRFVRGLVDSPDLPLNVSREMVQEDRRIGAIRKVLVKKLLDRFGTFAKEERETWEKVWSEVGPVLKEAFHYEPQQQDRLEPSLLFRTTHGDGWSSLEEIAERMQAGQEALYYLVGDDLATLRNSPHLEIFRERDVEVLLLTDPIDHVALINMPKLKGFEIKDAADPSIDPASIGGEVSEADSAGEDEALAADEGQLEALVAALKERLEASVADVRVSQRLRGSAACLVAGPDAPPPAVERMLRAMGEAAPERKRTLELNANHALIKRLATMFAEDAEQEQIVEIAELLVDQSLIALGERPRDVAAFARRLADVAGAAVGA